jgi:hypothetical protein
MESPAHSTRSKRPASPPPKKPPRLSVRRRLLNEGYSHLRAPFFPHCLKFVGLPPEIIQHIHQINHSRWIDACRDMWKWKQSSTFHWVKRQILYNTQHLYFVLEKTWGYNYSGDNLDFANAPLIWHIRRNKFSGGWMLEATCLSSDVFPGMTYIDVYRKHNEFTDLQAIPFSSPS